MRRKRTAKYGTHLRAWHASCAFLVLLLVVITVASAALTPLYPEEGKSVYTGKSVTLDASNTHLGYIMVKHKGSKKKLKVAIKYEKKDVLYYDLQGNNEFETYTLTEGGGTYQISVLENKSASGTSNSYSQLFNKKIKVKMADEKLAFVVPNSTVWYTKDSKAVLMAQELCQGLSSDKEKVTAVWNYLKQNMNYDFVKAATVKQGYTPDVDAMLKSKMGICYDYAALFACMLRSQGIPTKLIKGNLTAAGAKQYHAWNHVYIDGNWLLMDPTFPDLKYSASDYVTVQAY